MKFEVGDEVRLTGPFSWHTDPNAAEWDRRIVAINPQRIGIVDSNTTNYNNTLRVNYGYEASRGVDLLLFTDAHLLVHSGPSEDEVQEAIESIKKASS